MHTLAAENAPCQTARGVLQDDSGSGRAFQRPSGGGGQVERITALLRAGRHWGETRFWVQWSS